MGTWYASRADVKSALDYRETARNNVQVDRAIETASRAVNSLTRRRFSPTIGTKVFDWPNNQYAPTWRLWLEDRELISATLVTSGGVTIAPANYFLEPAADGPPYNRLEINLAGPAAFGSGNTRQRSISITGLWGYTDVSLTVGTLVGSLSSSATSLVVSNGATVDVGHTLTLDAERVQVNERAFAASGQTLAVALGASNAGQVVAVQSGPAINVGETISVDAERMLVVDVTGNNLTVRRAWDGSTLAAHLISAAVNVSRTFTVTRAVLGTTAATHNSAITVTRWVPPPLVVELTIGEATSILLQESIGFTKAGGNTDASGVGTTDRGLPRLRAQVISAHGRKGRAWAV